MYQIWFFHFILKKFYEKFPHFIFFHQKFILKTKKLFVFALILTWKKHFSFENGWNFRKNSCLRVDFDLKKTESKLELEQYIRQSQKWVTHFFVPLFHYFSQKRARNFWNAREKEKNQRKTGKNARKTTKMRRKTLILHIFGSFSSRKWVKSYNKRSLFEVSTCSITIPKASGRFHKYVRPRK